MVLSWVLTLLLLMIETGPIFFKLMIPQASMIVLKSKKSS